MRACALCNNVRGFYVKATNVPRSSAARGHMRRERRGLLCYAGQQVAAWLPASQQRAMHHFSGSSVATEVITIPCDVSGEYTCLGWRC